jgi:hypothetical protein
MRSHRKLGWIVALAGSSIVFQVNCYPLGTLVNTVNGVNPCLGILNCDPREYNFIRSGITGPGLQPDVDPFCTFPPFCTQAQDPIFGGLGVP